MNDLEFNVETR